MIDIRVKQKAKQIIATGFAFGLPKDFNFDPTKPYSGCLLCGKVYQGPLDLRVPPNHTPENSLIAQLAQIKRKQWTVEHAKTHPQHEHNMFALSGRFATPEAAQALAAKGVFSIVDMVIDDEISSALAEGSPIPIDEIEN